MSTSSPDATDTGEKRTLRERLWDGLLWRSDMHDGLRAIDLFMAWPVFALGLLVRFAWDSDWAMLSIPLAAVVVVQSNRRLFRTPPSGSKRSHG